MSAAPYFVRMSWYGLLHGHERPARPNIPPEVQEWYTPRPSDVIISPAAKSGTTWLLQIAHQLRVKGEEPTWDDQVCMAHCVCVVCDCVWREAWAALATAAGTGCIALAVAPGTRGVCTARP